MKHLLFVIVSLTAAFVWAKDDSRASFEGRYEVPVPAAEPELVPFASFPLDQISRRVRGDTARIEYDLPLDLTGAVNTIELTSTAGPDGAFREWSGPNGIATCAANQCDIAYKGLQIDLAAIEARLTGRGLPAGEIALRLRVAGHFRDDPHGRVIGERQIEYSQRQR